MKYAENVSKTTLSETFINNLFMPKLNWEIILSNLAEAREQIEEIEEKANSKKKPSEIELQIWLEHVYHHLNFAWNIRHKTSFNYSKLSEEEFNEWSRFPAEIEEKKIERNLTRD